MKNYINNSELLLSHGDRKLREIALHLINAALEASNPYQATKKVVHLSGDNLRVGPHTYDLSKKRNIYVLGTGKATFPIAKALEEVLGDRITQGVVVLKKGQTGRLNRIRIIEASHPIPDSNGLRGAREMMRLAKRAVKGDIVFACITGGSSALMPMPVDSIRLTEKKKVNRLLLSSGASIFEINAVRKHLSKIKGGRLALAIFPAELVNLTVSDVVGDALDYITGPTVPDTSTFEDALQTLKKYDLLKKVPPSVRAYLEAADALNESPKDFEGMPYHNFILTNSDSACNAAAAAAEYLGLKPMILSTMFDGESRELGRNFAAIAREIRKSQMLLKPPCVLIGGGETTVALKGNFGKGGPNQEFVVSTILSMGGQEKFIVAALDTDGTDGPTNVAGAMADYTTVATASAKGIDLQRSLKNHEVLHALISLEETIVTGHTGTNVNDLKFLILA
ncbi:MAG: glycerate kinase [Deltaproteobacteria bacterium]|nr:glycerate kinase [Deltaproteobacteria bacterium]